VPAEPLEQRRPTFLAGPFAALAHVFTVATGQGELHDYITAAFAGLATTDRPDHRYELSERPSAEGPIYELRRDGETVHRTHRAETVVGALCWNLNRAALASRPDLVAVHAAVAARGDQALLLPAAMESGKTTLVAGLVARGLQYLTDEMAAVDPATLLVHPYPKPLSIDRGSWPALRVLAPKVGPLVQPYAALQWQVGAQTAHADAIGGPMRPRWIVSPRYVRGGATRITPMSRGAMCVRLAEQAFRLDPEVLRTLARLARTCDCYEIQMGDLDAACDAVLALLD
jgi:hypothetical protein